MSTDALMWMIVLFGGCFVLIGLAKILLTSGLYVDAFMSTLRTAPWFDNIVLKAYFIIPVAAYCYFWYTAAMSLARSL